MNKTGQFFDVQAEIQSEDTLVANLSNYYWPRVSQLIQSFIRWTLIYKSGYAISDGGRFGRLVVGALR